MNVGLYDKAIDDYTEAIKLNPNLAETYYNRGISFYYTGDYQLALKDYDKAIELDPNNQRAIANKKQLLEEHPELKPQSSSSKSGGSC